MPPTSGRRSPPTTASPTWRATPCSSELLRRIARQEARHVAFYASQARDRLAESKKAQVIARFALSRFWGPVGSGIETDEEVKHVLSHLMGGEEGLIEIRKIDGYISAMPGLDGLRIVETALAKRGVPGYTVPEKVKRAA